MEYQALIWEPVFRLPISDPVVMSDQLRHLNQLSERPNVTVRVVPERVPWHPGSAGPFVFYEFRDASPVIHFEHHSSGAFDQDADDVDAYRGAIRQIANVALSADDSRDLIERISKDEWNQR